MMQNIGSYKVVRLLGKGGMSEVYEVENSRLGSRHALKLFAYKRDDAEVRDRFLTEGKLLARLNHPRIVRVTDLGTDESSGQPYFVMDLVLDGKGRVRSLADVEPGTVDEAEIGRWYDDLREGLSYIHANGVVHRDLKLQNVLLGPDGHVVLTDFGISKIMDGIDGHAPIVDTVNTIVKLRDGKSLVMGSLGYMAPELEMGVAASPQSDWYALGVIVYRLLTGTWCDSRTDLGGTLDTYDPVWRRIIPKLLHANPQGRECLPYAEERDADRERMYFEQEERGLWAETKASAARRLAVCLGCGCVLVAVGGLLLFVWTRARLKVELDREAALEAKLALPTFSDVCRLPKVDSRLAVDGDMSRNRLTLIDAWVLTYGLFDDLHMGKVTSEKVIERLEELARKSEEGSLSLFSDYDGYMPNGDARLLTGLLRAAAAEMKKRSRP